MLRNGTIDAPIDLHVLFRIDKRAHHGVGIIVVV